MVCLLEQGVDTVARLGTALGEGKRRSRRGSSSISINLGAGFHNVFF